MGAVTKPWHDTPRCRPCGGPLVTPEWAGRRDRVSDPGHRLICCACGISCLGTDAEVEQAKKADAAYDAARDRGEV